MSRAVSVVRTVGKGSALQAFRVNSDRSRTPVQLPVEQLQQQSPSSVLSSVHAAGDCRPQDFVQFEPRSFRVETVGKRSRKQKFFPALPVIYEDAELAW